MTNSTQPVDATCFPADSRNRPITDPEKPVKNDHQNQPGNADQLTLDLFHDTSSFPVSQTPAFNPFGKLGNRPPQIGSFPVSRYIPPVGGYRVTGKLTERGHDPVHLPNSIQDIDRVDLPLSTTAIEWNDQDAATLANVLHWQDLEVSRWIMTRAVAYDLARGWPSASCYFQAAIDWELWRRRAYIPELDHHNPNPSRQIATEQYMYQMQTLEPPRNTAPKGTHA